MLVITTAQFEHLKAIYQDDFLLEVICDWYALFERVYGASARISFEDAWEIAEYLVERLASLPQDPERDVTYELIHRVLLAAEQGVSWDQVHIAVEQFCLGLPAHEAAFALLRLELMSGSASPANA